MIQAKKSHRKDGSFRRGNAAASKGEERRMWSGRLPVSAIARAKALVDAGRFESQADAIAAALKQLG